MSPSEVASSRNDKREEFFMRKALQVAQQALNTGEVPVGCVIVWDGNGANLSPNDDGTVSHQEVSTTQFDYVTSQDVIISHGANQVNATRDATRHAECVAIDRLLSGGMMSDKNRLPQNVIENAYPQSGDSFPDFWMNIPDSPTHWKNSYGWGSKKLFKRSRLRECDLYVTVEPCISKSTLHKLLKIYMYSSCPLKMNLLTFLFSIARTHHFRHSGKLSTFSIMK